IGEPFVKAAIVFRRDVNSCERASAERFDLGEGLSILYVIGGLTARAGPNCARVPDHGNQRCRQSSGDWFIRFCPCDTVGNDDHSHRILLQFRAATTSLATISSILSFRS